MASRFPFRIGIDLGGTKIEAAAVDHLGTVRVRRRVGTPADNYRATIEAITALVEVIERRIGETTPVGIGIPGTISPITGLVKNANSTWLIGRALQQDLEGALGRPIRLANDANCFALSEATDGAAMGMTTVFGVISRHRGRRGDRARRTDPPRSQRHCRRMGPQPIALAGSERDPGPGVLLWPLGLCRDFSFWAGARGGSSSPRRAKPECDRNRRLCRRW